MCKHSATNESLKLALHERRGAAIVITSVELPKEGLKMLADEAVQQPMLRTRRTYD